MTTNETQMTEEYYFMIKIYNKDGEFCCYWDDEEMRVNYWLHNEKDEVDLQFDKAIRFYETLKNDEGEYDCWEIEVVKMVGAEFPNGEEEEVIDDFVVNGEN